MKNKTGIISALVLSLAIAGSAFAGVQAQDNNQTGSMTDGSKTQMTKKSSGSKKHRTARHAKKTKSAKTSSSTKK